MTSHQYSVGLLSEMPPEGKVGISPVCILGFNRNRGMEISLRLRTDDLKGFRKYGKIRETLIHELAHMEWDDHDNNFKAYNSQLLKECAKLDWASSGAGHVLHASGAFDEESEVDAAETQPSGPGAQPNVLSATMADSGKTLRQLAGTEKTQYQGDLVSARLAAAEAAYSRVGQSSSRGPLPAATGARGKGAAQEHAKLDWSRQPEALQNKRQGVSLTSGADTEPYAQNTSRVTEYASTDTSTEQQYGEPIVVSHDAKTEESEASMRRLGTFDEKLAQEVENAFDALESLSSVLSDDADAERDGQSHVGNDMVIEEGALNTDIVDGPHQREDVTEQMMSQFHAGNTLDINVPKAEAHKVEGQARQEGNNHSAAECCVPETQGCPNTIDDTISSKLQQAEHALQKLLGSPFSNVQESVVALETLETLLQNALIHPDEDKYRRIRLQNATYHNKVGRFQGSEDLLNVAGFTRAENENEAFLTLTRHDPALVWLVLSVVQDAKCRQKRHLECTSKAATGEGGGRDVPLVRG